MILGLTLLALSEPAQAQSAEPTERPAEKQPPGAESSSLLAARGFSEGTTLFKQLRFDEAEQRFLEALTHWDHPLIHLYLSRALEKQGRLVEAYEALQPALRIGVEPPLPPKDVQVAEDLQQSLESRLARLEVHCAVPGAEVFLDGEPWFTAPGQPRRMISAGQHVLMARKLGYFPVTKPVSLLPAKQTRVVLRMTADVVHVERRWQPWQPWVVAGTGLAMSLTGGLLLWKARADYAALRRDLDSCRELSCSPTSTRRNDRAEWKERIGTGALIVGGSALAAGLAGVLLNLPRYRRSEPARDLEDLDITPMFSGNIAGISLQIQF